MRMIFGFMALFFAGQAVAEAPRTVVSLNLCTDELALAFAQEGQIAGVSFNVGNAALSTFAEQAKPLPKLRGSAEEMLALKPDLVLMGEGQQPELQHWMRGRGMNVLAVPLANTLEATKRNIRQVAKQMGNPAAGEAAIRRMQNAFSVPYGSSNAPRVAVYYPRGYSDGRGTFMDAMLHAIGARHLGAEKGVEQLAYMPLETLVRLQPDVVLTQDYGFHTQTQGEVLLAHPALKALKAERVTIPGNLLVCPALHVADIIARLKEAWPGKAAYFAEAVYAD
ncbi:MAG: ABC transporter substrate-binding protein [Rickettsiales bacterium]